MQFRKLAPKSLYGRFLLIIILPAVLVQCIAIYMFYERHWASMSRNMAATLGGEVRYVTSALSQIPKTQHKSFLSGIETFMNMRVVPLAPADKETIKKTQSSYDFFERYLEYYTEADVAVYNTDDDKWLVIDMHGNNSNYRFITSQKKLANPSTYIFILWMTGAALIMTVVAVLFLKNQLRAIVRLTDAAEHFDRGVDEDNFKPGGATEVRRAAIAFIEMRERIKQLITKRHEAISNVVSDVEPKLDELDELVSSMRKSKSSDELKKKIKSTRTALKKHQPKPDA